MNRPPENVPYAASLANRGGCGGRPLEVEKSGWRTHSETVSVSCREEVGIRWQSPLHRGAGRPAVT